MPEIITTKQNHKKTDLFLWLARLLLTWILENEPGMKNISYDRSTFVTFYMCSTLSEKIGFESFLGLFIHMICNFPETFKLCHLYKKVNLTFSIFIRIGKITQEIRWLITRDGRLSRDLSGEKSAGLSRYRNPAASGSCCLNIRLRL